MSNRVFLEGDRVTLRGLELEDLQGNYPHWFDDGQVCQGNTHHRFPYAYAELEAYIKGLSGNRDTLVLAIVDKESESHIGNISLQSIDWISRNAEFAILLGEKGFWNKGLSKEAGSLIVDHGFQSLNLERIYCGTFQNNTGMRKLALSLGFKEEGIRRKAVYKNGLFLDVVEYGLLREEWKPTI